MEVPESMRLKEEAIRLRVEAIELKLESIELKLNPESMRLKEEAIRLKVEAIELKLESIELKLDPESMRLKAEAMRLKVEAIDLEVEPVDADEAEESHSGTASGSFEETVASGEDSVVETASESHWSPLSASISTGVQNLVKNMYPMGTIVNDPFYKTWLWRLFESHEQMIWDDKLCINDFTNDQKIVYKFIVSGTTLHWAVKVEDLELVTRILEAGEVDVNAKDEWWKATALHWAVRTGNVDILEAMWKHHMASGKFDLRIKDVWGFTAFEYAVFSGVKPNYDMLVKLLKFKNYPYRDEEGVTHFYFDKKALRERYLIFKVEQVLRMGGSNTEEESHFKSSRFLLYDEIVEGTSTYLQWAVRMEDATLVAHILGVCEIDVNDAPSNSYPPLISAVRSRNLDIVNLMVTKYIESSNFNVNHVDEKTGYTLLHWAIVSGDCQNIDMVKELLRCEGTMRLTEECLHGKTPLQLAHERGFKDIQKILIERDVVRQYVEDLYRDRQVYVDAANAILVSAALIASVTFASWLQPPLGYTPDYVNLQQNSGLQVFWEMNCLSFYFAIATVVFGARSVLPNSPYFIKVKVEKLKNNLFIPTILLGCSVLSVIITFGTAGYIVLTPLVEFQLSMIIPTILGGLVCLISLVFLSYNMWEDSFGKQHVAKRRYDWSEYSRGYLRS